ncbi:sensor histidine kinase [Caulobacter soli]|uniref:sensor histidine kinase n=1 Tax=Caulobacter soli TaxID=2708539 RepID=UPI0013ECFBCA|nr:sensor histidine kinase [Caulobacter soli]
MSNSTPAHWDEKRLRSAVKAAGVALWSWNVDTDQLDLDDQAFELWDLPPSDEVCFEDLSSRIHPSDRDRVRAAFATTRAIVGAYDLDFRILVGDAVRWISARGTGVERNAVDRVVLGVFLDITGRKQAEEGHELLAGEMSHRVKNLLNIATGLTAITARSATTPAQMAEELMERLTALGRAHDLVRPIPGKQGKAALLGDLVTVLLAPHDDLGAFKGRIRVSVPRMGVGNNGATALALVLHELATNSMKYGALSDPAGSLDVSCGASGDDLVIIWTERGGPRVTPPSAEGFGSSLIARSMSRQLGGSLDYAWDPDGLIVTVTVKANRLAT